MNTIDNPVAIDKLQKYLLNLERELQACQAYIKGLQAASERQVIPTSSSENQPLQVVRVDQKSLMSHNLFQLEQLALSGDELGVIFPHLEQGHP